MNNWNEVPVSTQIMQFGRISTQSPRGSSDIYRGYVVKCVRHTSTPLSKCKIFYASTVDCKIDNYACTFEVYNYLCIHILVQYYLLNDC